MDDRPIGLIDSGVGGFTVLKALQTYFPQENFLYFGDSKNMPYGEKENDEIIKLVNRAIDYLEKQNVKLIILACNTASGLIDSLTSTVPLFNIIEAGCRAVLDHQTSGPVGLIATRATVKNKAYDKLMKELSEDVYFISYGTPDLAQVINNRLEEIELLKENIHQAIDPILEKYPIKNLVLGCTHYPIVRRTIQELYPNLWLIDPAYKENRIIEHFLESNSLKAIHPQADSIIYINGSEEDLNRSKDLLNELEITYKSLNKIDNEG